MYVVGKRVYIGCALIGYVTFMQCSLLLILSQEIKHLPDKAGHICQCSNSHLLSCSLWLQREAEWNFLGL